jgi:hypothetical protein
MLSAYLHVKTPNFHDNSSKGKGKGKVVPVL